MTRTSGVSGTSMRRVVDMGWKELARKAKIAAGVDEDRSVADEAAAELARQAKENKDKEEEK